MPKDKNKLSLLVPIPEIHFLAGRDLLKSKDFVAFGSDALKTFRKLEKGIRILIYVSRGSGGRKVRYEATYEGYEEDPDKMRALLDSGHRPTTTKGETWKLYWKVSEIKRLPEPIPLDEIQLSKKYLAKGAYPRRPLHVLN